MAERNRKNLRRSKQADDRGSRPNSAHASGRSTPDPRSSSQPTVDPHFGIIDPRPIGQRTHEQQRIAGPSRSQRSHVPQPAPYPSFSSQATPNQQRIADPYGSQPILEATYGGYPGSYYSRQPTFDPRFSDLSIADQRFGGQPTFYRQRVTDPYGFQPILEATSSVQRVPVPRLTPYPSSSTPNQPRITDPYGGQSIPQATSSGHSDPYSSIRPTPELLSGQRTFDPRSSNRGAQRTPDPIPIGQSTSAPWFSTSVPRSGRQPTINPHFGNQPSDPRARGQHTPSHQRIINPYPGSQHIIPPNSSGQSISDGIYTITNVYQRRFIYLEDGNDKTPLRGHYDPENRSTRWLVKRRVDEEYSIENVDHSRYANCESRPRLEAFVEGHHDQRLWRIRESFVGGQYTIAAIDNGNLWKLPDNGEDTPVSFSKVPSDPMCLWAFERAGIMAPVNENRIALPFMPNTGLPFAPSSGQPMPETAIVEFTSVIVVATGLLQPLRAACEALRVVLQKAESIGHVDKDRAALIKRLKFHLATIKNDIAKLEEDQNIDKVIPVLNQDVRESLETYARELKESHELLSDNQPRILTNKTLKIDGAFQRYSDALYQFAANAVAQMQQLAPFGQGAHTVAEKVRPNRPNAYGIQHRECLQGTREKTLRAISDWFGDETTEKWIFFFLDVAGSGKSTVAKHMAEKWEREERLLARFFFSRDTTETMSTNSFCSTVAGAFSALDPTYKEHMDKFMELPNVELLSFEKRFEGLVVGPLRAIGQRAILIIDALDECHPEQRDQLLHTLRGQHSSIPFLRILTTGRPERDIKRWAEKEYGFGYTNFIQLEESEKDVELYIKHTLQDVPDIQDRLYPVIRRAEGLFVWARIACDLLLNSVDIDGLLEELGKEVSLDYLYKVALQQSMPKDGASQRAMVLVLQMILAVNAPLSIAELEMLSPKRGVVEKVVTHLSSVLLYRGRDDPIRLLHATFREFLTTRSKADIFFIQPELGHHTLASGCLNTIGYLSKQDDSTFRASDAIYERKENLFEQDTR